METAILTHNNLTLAADVIRRGGLVAVPTETVYGLAANGLDAASVESIYEVKGRPAQKPMSLMVSDIDAATEFAVVTDTARKLAEAFWPGPLTLVLKKLDNVPDIVTAGGDTVGLRCPGHPVTLALLRETGTPLAAPSANPSGLPDPKSAADVLAYFSGKIDCVIDGGECALGVPSTIIDLTAEPYRILRHGALDEREILRVLNGG